MSSLRILAVMAILVGGLAGVLATPAKADVATRCDWRGCVHIACNWTGDRCHRFYGGEGYYRSGYYPGRYGYDGYRPDYDRYRDRDDYGYYRDRDNYRSWHYDCDHDADDCYVHRSDDWNGGY